jgi:hypothetical protein
VRHRDLTAAAGGATEAVGTPSAYVDASGTNVVIYRGDDGHIHDLYWVGQDAPTAEDISGFVGSAPAASDPAAYYIAQHDLHQIVYTTGNGGDLIELFWQGANATLGRSLFQAAPTPFRPYGKPLAYYNAATDTKHVIYPTLIGGGARLFDLSWPATSSTIAVRDLTRAALARNAVTEAPAAFVVGGADHLAYRGFYSHHVYEILPR